MHAESLIACYVRSVVSVITACLVESCSDNSHSRLTAGEP